MLTFWFLIWLALSVGVLGFAGWTVFVLQSQKLTWQNFAKKYKLRYTAKAFLQSPDVSGTVEGYTVDLFSGEHVAEDFRGTRKLSAMEIKLSSTMPFEAAIGSGGMVPVIRQLNMKEELTLEHEGWSPSFIAASNNKPALQAYMTPERLAALTGLMKIKNSWVIFIFRGDTMLLRFDTADALHEMPKLEKLLQKMIAVARVLELGKGEEARLKMAEAQKPAPGVVVLKADDQNLGGGLELED